MVGRPLLDRLLDRYSGVGLGLMVFGAPFAVYSYVVLLNTPLAALGLACVVLGGTLLLVPGSLVRRFGRWLRRAA